jgi:N-acetylglutamate synthase-like GNAT family acetyltransferase
MRAPGGIAFRMAGAADLPAVAALLAAVQLPDAVAAGMECLLAEHDGALLGTVALERSGEDALLRSLAVAPAQRGAGLGHALLGRALEHARRRGVKHLYLLTTTAEGFFAARGFARIAREAVPVAVRAHPQFTTLCPANAVCMTRAL